MTLIRNITEAIRPKHLIKSSLLLLAIVDTKNLLSLQAVTIIIAGMLIFYIMSASLYLFNDILDVNRDRLDPVKRQRPVASGNLPLRLAIFIAIILCTSSILVSFYFSVKFGSISVIYILVTTLYNVKLKHMVLLDTIVPSCSAVIRVASGYILLDTTPSLEILVLVFFCSFLLALNRREYEARIGGIDSAKNRPVLSKYSYDLIKITIPTIGGAFLVLYSMYCIHNPHTYWLVVTIPIMVYIVFGILNFYWLQSTISKDVQFLFMNNKNLIISILLWIAVVTILIYI